MDKLTYTQLMQHFKLVALGEVKKSGSNTNHSESLLNDDDDHSLQSD